MTEAQTLRDTTKRLKTMAREFRQRAEEILGAHAEDARVAGNPSARRILQTALGDVKKAFRELTDVHTAPPAPGA